MTILICDDDHSTVDVLTSQLDFEAFGIDKILTAYNGKAAMELAEKEKPEIILCDIDMPQANGIDVLKRVHELGFLCAFSFLTAYESFSYARDAIRYGAVNYLTKPFTMEEVSACVEGMAEYVDRHDRAMGEKEKTAYTEKIKRDELNSILRAIRDGFYGENRESLKVTLQNRNMTLSADALFRTVSIRVNLECEKTKNWDSQLLQYSFRYLTQEAVADRLDFSYFLADPDGSIEMIQLFVEEERFTEEELVKRCRTLIRMSKQNLGVEPVCYISEVRPLYQMERARQDRRKAEEYRLQEGRIILEGDELDHPEEEDSLLLIEERILAYLQQRNKTDYMKNIGDLVQQISESGSGSEHRMAQLHHDLMQTLFRCLSDNQIQAHVLFNNPMMKELDKNAERSVFDFIRFSAMIYDEAIEALKTVEGNSDILTNVKKYIAEHFREDIDRNDIAQVAYITPNYLSKRFRQDTGLSLRDYINKLRVKESKRLLLTTTMPVSTIAMEVGFGNISYFSTVFRKYTGTSPIEWRDNPSVRKEQEDDE